MNNQKTVKSANSEKGAVLYIVTCALVVIQPLLDILSSIVINLGKANYISVSGAVRAVIIVAVTVFTLGFYKGNNRTLFKVYSGIAAAYITAEAAAQGLGSCILGWFEDDKIRRICGLQSPVRLVITLGYAAGDDKLRVKKRKELGDLVSYK